MTEIALIMPMAGRGSRFRVRGYPVPKPLVDLFGRPFFEWAVESVRRVLHVQEMVFVVLREHIDLFAIDEAIRVRYPEAKIVAISDTTSGAAETAAIGLDAVQGNLPIAINDCDHAFDGRGLEAIVAALRTDAAAAIVGFRSNNPAYSFVHFDQRGHVAGTAEKQVVSQSAIAGCYFFNCPDTYRKQFNFYRDHCPYPELFVSGLYNNLAARDEKILYQELLKHLPFGTPEEVDALRREDFDFLRGEI
jgi:dTDP-glucose pyrophosphorylase